MLIKNLPEWHLPEREATSESLFVSRRQWLAGAVAAGLVPAAMPFAPALAATPDLPRLKAAKSRYVVKEDVTSYEDITSYNNFYEFGTDKGDPARYAGSLKARPWTITVEGLVNKPKRFDVDALIRTMPLEERTYRFRCVEAWSMVVPWVGFPLSALLKEVEPTANAKYVQFVTLADPKQMPGLRYQVVNWPYVEGLRLDEAMHPLTLMTVGLYGRILPNQNGAPIRLIVPWKYGFKNIKSIVAIRLTDRQPKTAWNELQPSEYGFYSNVNPDVDHPRWSQKKERRIGEFLRRPTLPFNGYADQVAGLYKGMDLRKYI